MICVQFDFLQCSFWAHNAICFLDRLSRLIESKNGRVQLLWDTMSNWMQTTLCQNGFRRAFEGDIRFWDGSSIPYKEYTINNKAVMPHHEINEYLSEHWLGKNAISLSKGLDSA